MLKSVHLVAAIIGTSCLVPAGVVTARPAQEPDYPCYVQDASGRISNLSTLCGPSPTRGRSTSSGPTVSTPTSTSTPRTSTPRTSTSSKAAECRQFETVALSFVRQMSGLMKQTTSRKDVRDVERLIGLYNQFATDLEAIPMRDPTLISLRSRYAKFVRNASNLLQRALSEAQSGNVAAANKTISTLEGSTTQGIQLGQEIDRYCRSK